MCSSRFTPPHPALARVPRLEKDEPVNKERARPPPSKPAVYDRRHYAVAELHHDQIALIVKNTKSSWLPKTFDSLSFLHCPRCAVCLRTFMPFSLLTHHATDGVLERFRRALRRSGEGRRQEPRPRQAQGRLGKPLPGVDFVSFGFRAPFQESPTLVGACFQRPRRHLRFFVVGNFDCIVHTMFFSRGLGLL